jgi:4-hydroxy-3-polyprenylbenzoate decarboxylase
MSFAELRSFLSALESAGELHRVRVEVEPELEITEIAVRAVKENLPALLFENVKGSTYPVAIGVLGSERRIELALGRHPQQIGEELLQLLERLNPPSPKAILQSLPGIFRFTKMRRSRSLLASSQEIAEEPDLSTMPIIKCWPKDGGRFITFGLVITHDPRKGRRNMGVYRMQVLDQRSTGMHWHIAHGGSAHAADARGRTLDVAVVIGCDPAMLLASVAPLPEGMDEIAFAGYLRGKPTPMTHAKTIGIDVPANAEIILEGTVDPNELKPEGPFGDHFGHYSHIAQFPVFRIRRVTRRRKPVYLAAVVGKPPQEDKFIGNATQEMLAPLVQLIHPEIEDLWAYYETGFHSLLVVSVRERYHKEAIKAAFGLLGIGQTSLTKVLVLVSDGVAVRDFHAVLREIQSNFNPSQDFLLLPGTAYDTLDFTSFTTELGSKMILDATRKRRRSSQHSANSSQDYEGKVVSGVDPGTLVAGIVSHRYLEGTLLAVRVTGNSREIVQHLVQHPLLGNVKIIAAVSPDVDLSDDESLLWGIFTRFEPARDIVFAGTQLRGSLPVYSGPLGIDAAWKEGYPEPLVMDERIVKRVDENWGRYWR